MKKLLFVSLIALGSGIVNAQESFDQKILKKVSDRLEMTESQKNSAKAIYDKYKSQEEALFNQLMEIDNKKWAEIKQVLTDEQVAKYDKMEKRFMDRWDKKS